MNKKQQIEEAAKKFDSVINMWKNPDNEMDGLHTLEVLKTEILELLSLHPKDINSLMDLRENLHDILSLFYGEQITEEQALTEIIAFIPLQSKVNTELPTDEEIEKAANKKITNPYNSHFRPSFIKGAKWMRSKVENFQPKETTEADKWISVETELPKESGRYLGYIVELGDLGNHWSTVNVAFNINHKNDSSCWTEDGEVVRVTHWMPLPNPPRIP